MVSLVSFAVRVSSFYESGTESTRTKPRRRPQWAVPFRQEISLGWANSGALTSGSQTERMTDRTLYPLDPRPSADRVRREELQQPDGCGVVHDDDVRAHGCCDSQASGLVTRAYHHCTLATPEVDDTGCRRWLQA